MQLTARIRSESGSALVTTMLVVVVMLALGIALLSLNDVQAKQSGVERTRDRAFNLAESVLTSEGYSLGRAWPVTGLLSPIGAAGTCTSTGVGALISAVPAAGSAVARIQGNLTASYSGSEYAGATWQVNVCDDTGLSSVWSAALLNGWNYDQNNNNRMWIRAQATVAGKTRVVAGLVDLENVKALPTNFGLVNGSMSVDLPTSLGGASNSLLGSVLGLVLGQSDSLITGRIAVRCGVFSINIVDDCLGGAGLAPLLSASSGLLGSTVATNIFSQYPVESVVPQETIDQFRSQAIATGTYVATTAGSSAASPAGTISGTPPLCTKPAGLGPTKIWFIEQVGTGDQYCRITAGATPQAGMVVVGSGRLLIRGNNNANDPSHNGMNSVVYALNLQRPANDTTLTPDARELVRIDQAGRVVGAVFVDGKNGRVGLYPIVDCGLLGLGCLLGGLLGTLVGAGQQGPLIEYNAAVVSAVKVFTTSSVVAGTFRDLAGS
jgi:hypothetical protein